MITIKIKNGTIRRDTFKKWVDAGYLIGRCTNNLTDDYAWDSANNFGRTEYLPAVIVKDVWRMEGKMLLQNYYFDLGSRCYYNEGIINFVVCNSQYFSLKFDLSKIKLLEVN